MLVPVRGSPGRAPALRTVITFIIRRLIATMFLLIVVSMITFAIFFIIPRLAGQNTYQLAAQYVGRNPTRQAVLQIEAQLGLDRPLYLQYGNFLKGIVFGAHYNAGPPAPTARRRASATRSGPSSRCGRRWSATCP